MLEFQNVSISVQRTPLISDLSLTIPKNKITVLVGPNGCGKTTLLESLNGGSQVTAGDILLNGESLLRLSPKERALRLSFLPQVRTVIPSIPTKTLVEHGRFPHLGFARRKSPKDTAVIQQAMEYTHVADFSRQNVDTLSGGIRQRAFLAMLLAQDTEYLVLDEPTTYLDLSGQAAILQLVRQLKADGKTVILVLHDLQQALQIADYLVVMENRKIIAADTPEKCLQSGVLESVFHVTIKIFQDRDGRYYFFQPK